MTTVATITVAQLIEHLKTLPGDLEVLYRCWSEQVALELSGIEVVELCEPRPDGWVQNKRPDKPTRMYVLFP